MLKVLHSLRLWQILTFLFLAALVNMFKFVLWYIKIFLGMNKRVQEEKKKLG